MWTIASLYGERQEGGDRCQLHVGRMPLQLFMSNRARCALFELTALTI